jgi:hypothetical protein
MSEKKIVIQGKEIDYGDMDNNSLIRLYDELLQRQAKLLENAKQYLSESEIEEININNI